MLHTISHSDLNDIQKSSRKMIERTQTAPIKSGSPEETRTLVKGSRGPYAWPLHHRAPKTDAPPKKEGSK